MGLCRLSRCVSVISINLVPKPYVRVWYLNADGPQHQARIADFAAENRGLSRGFGRGFCLRLGADEAVGYE